VQRITISIPDDLKERVHAELDYEDNRSEWIRDAIQAKLDSEQQPDTQKQSEARETRESGFVLPDTVPDRIDRQDAREAIEAAVRFIEKGNGATMREIVTTVGQKHSLGYDVPEELEQGERYRSAYWRKCLKPGLENHPNIQKPKPGQSEWRYVE
jgi:predicted transcriptional regulator